MPENTTTTTETSVPFLRSAVTSQAVEEHIVHLLGTKTEVPFLLAGHFAPDDARATPLVDSLAWTGAGSLHPFNAKPLIQVNLEGDERVLFMAYDRVVCVDNAECTRCDQVWWHFQLEVNEVPDGASISGLLDAGLPGPVVVEASDLPPEAFEESDDSNTEEAK
ncbi:hypothetical protein [Brevibacterium sp. SMBL_HHYL_HB1]|jgi:hypothetical protein|uniref:hypothetical protein n=1 Tax=Brevibacterium sp. SMBL_HHYL_HB1 TaxID=2777556 RepID=UPI001BA4F330|nr:hypothetical protein [Brevibacterium sp. SMBL_HHYL_HB1]QUL78077.1 hypothetical protein IG171_11350 [Brevibacterium sp. SMBL_HHYL_HB1]